MLKVDRKVFIENKPESLESLYQRHGGMLLGYIFEVVQDRKLAEKYLVEMFCELSQQFDQMNWNGTNSWCQLQRFAKGWLMVIIGNTRYFEPRAVTGLMHSSCNKYLEQLNNEQRQVFCDVYYHGKMIPVISKELNKTEDSIRKTLKEAFAIMRKSGEN